MDKMDKNSEAYKSGKYDDFLTEIKSIAVRCLADSNTFLCVVR